MTSATIGKTQNPCQGIYPVNSENPVILSKLMIATRLLIFISTFCCFAGIGNAQLHIRVNQLGFAPDSPKSAIVFSPAPVPTGFQIINATTNAVVFKGQVRPLTGAWGEFDHHAELDFTSLTAEGSYVIEIGPSRSRKFTISRTINDLECTARVHATAALRLQPTR